MGVLILTGMPGAGKEELVSVAIELGYKVRRMGDVVRAEAAKNGIPAQDVGRFAHEERQRHGYDIWAKRIVPLVGDGNTLIDGCRGMSEVNVFHQVPPSGQQGEVRRPPGPGGVRRTGQAGT